MNEQDFQARLAELIERIGDLPENEQDRIKALAEETKDRHTRMRKTIGELQESLDYLRLSVKYLVFDLEATRRENGYLRKLIQADQPEHHDDEPHDQD